MINMYACKLITRKLSWGLWIQKCYKNVQVLVNWSNSIQVENSLLLRFTRCKNYVNFLINYHANKIFFLAIVAIPTCKWRNCIIIQFVHTLQLHYIIAIHNWCIMCHHLIISNSTTWLICSKLSYLAYSIANLGRHYLLLAKVGETSCMRHYWLVFKVYQSSKQTCFCLCKIVCFFLFILDFHWQNYRLH